MPVEDQVVQIYAATNGYLDRITVEKVDKFLAGLTENVRGNEPDLLKKIADGDWSDETQSAVDKAVAQYAEDFGFDLDEEGHPLEEGDDEPRSSSSRSEDGSGEEQKESGDEGEEEKEEEAVPA
jgi:F-type H+-transporting ATPase subunit alpha